jgi:hypothetical protein
MLVILRRRFLSPKDLFTTTAAPKEAKTTQSPLNLVRFGLFALLLGRISTGSSFSASRPPNQTFLPLFTTLYHILAVSC